MAISEKTTSTVNLYINEDGGGQTIWKLNDPKQNLTAEQIRNALAKFFATSNNLGVNLLKTRGGNEYIGFERAEYEVITKRTETIQ